MKAYVLIVAGLVCAPLIALCAAEKVRQRDRPAAKSAEAAAGAAAISTNVAAKLTVLPAAGDAYRRDQEVLLTTFREEDVLAGTAEAQARVKANIRLVSKGGVQ